jgi:hypothetical protein
LTDSELGVYRTSDELLDPLHDAARVRAIGVHWIGLSGFVGTGLMFAGITETCAMGLMLARMP